MWKPIQTAPKNRRIMLAGVWYGESTVEFGRWVNGEIAQKNWKRKTRSYFRIESSTQRVSMRGVPMFWDEVPELPKAEPQPNTIPEAQCLH